MLKKWQYLFFPLMLFIFAGCGGSGSSTSTSATLVSIAVTPASQSLPVDATQQFTALGTYSDKTTKVLTSSVTWESSDHSVATIDASGMVTPVAAGTTTIKASLGIDSNPVTLTVTNDTLQSIIVTPVDATAYIDIPIPQQFMARGYYSDGSNRDLTASVTWSSSDENIASMSTAGVATPVSAGSVTITATKDVTLPVAGTMTGSTTFTVAPDSLVKITVTPVNPSVALGDPMQFYATGTYADNSTADLTAYVTWSSSEEDVATIGNIGANGVITTVGEGTTTITATLRNFSDSTTLTVTPAYVPNSSNGFALYNLNCSGCHGGGLLPPSSVSPVAGATATQIQQAISGIGQMNFLSTTLTLNQIRDIAAALAP